MAGEGHVVLVHGFPLTAELWKPQEERLPFGWRLHAPDLPGFGRSAAAPANSMDAMARAVLDSMDAAGIGKAVIGGLSMGGYVTFAMYRLAPERFSGMVLANTRAGADSEQGREGRRTMIALAREKGAAAIADEMVPKLLGESSRRERPALVARVRQMIEQNSTDTIVAALEAMLQRPDSTPFLSRIDVPAAVFSGSEDTIIAPSEAESMHRQMPDSRLRVLDRTGHMSNLEAPDAFSSSLAAFLASVEPASSR